MATQPTGSMLVTQLPVAGTQRWRPGRGDGVVRQAPVIKDARVDQAEGPGRDEDDKAEDQLPCRYSSRSVLDRTR